ncbi:MAG: hypothetical protein ACFE9Z_14715 [Promethearchaeota archaeon]
MFNLEEFENNQLLEKVDKLNKLLSKNKVDKILKILDEFLDLLNQQELVVAITYILSILSEKKIELISERIIKRIKDFINSENPKVKNNSLIIIGFAMLANSNYITAYYDEFIKFLLDKSEDTRNNILFFLQELVKIDPVLINSKLDIIIDSFKLEKKTENVISLLYLLDSCNSFDFDHLFKLRRILISLLSSIEDINTSPIFLKLIGIIKKLFSNLNEVNLENMEMNTITDLIDSQFIMKKYDFTSIRKKKDVQLKDFLNEIAKSTVKDEKLYFYVKFKENNIFVYELEKRKLKSFFESNSKISDEEINRTFSNVVNNKAELKAFIKTINNLKIVDGYYSDIGFFYPKSHFKAKILEDLNSSGEIDINRYKFLPRSFINDIIKEISNSLNYTFLMHKNNEIYYSFKEIGNKINLEAARRSIIELKPYRDLLSEEDFIKLIKKMPKEYLSENHKGTQWLTNLGVLKITNEVQNSKIVGYFNISRISKKLNIDEILLLDVFDQFVDYRSGIWDVSKNIFYYSKFIKERIDKISKITDEEEKLYQIEKISKELNISKNHIVSKIDENLKLIAEEIKRKDQIKIEDYLEKTGMNLEDFLKFIDGLGISYFKKADLLIFNPQKIEDAKNDIKYLLIDKSKSVNYISLGTYEITSNLIKDLISDLLNDKKLRGIFYEDQGEVTFYTEKGIRNLMLENSFLFSFNDLFYGKKLNQGEIDLMREIFDDLIKNKRIKGSFDEEALTFSSDDVIFARDYNTVLFEFEKMVNNYKIKFETEFQKIKKILTKKQETIYPQEIKVIQEAIDKINEKYINWRSGLEAFIRNTNKKLLRDQGISIKKYKTLFSEKKKEEIKSLEEDPEIIELFDDFNRWINLYNKLELKYPNIIFYQKRLINNPEDLETKNKLSELLEELNLN